MQAECSLMRAGVRRMRLKTAVMKIRAVHVHEQAQKLAAESRARKYIREVAEELEPGAQG